MTTWGPERQGRLGGPGTGNPKFFASEGPESWAMDGDLEVKAGSFGVSLLSTWKDKREGSIRPVVLAPFASLTRLRFR